MVRYMALAAVLVVSLATGAQAQVGYGYNPYGYNPYAVQQPTYYSPYGVSVYRAPYVVTPYGYAPTNGYHSGYAQPSYRYKPGYVAPAPVPVPVYAPSTGGAFGGSPNNGNYYYWLQQQAAQGRMSQNAVNKIMYPGR